MLRSRSRMATTSFLSLFAALALGAALAPGCSGNSTVIDEAEAPPPASAAAEPTPTPRTTPSAPLGGPSAAGTKPTESAPPAAPTDDGKKKLPGAACDTSVECGSGVCEGEGCGPGQGKCADPDRKCTMDLRQYCGCEGKTFNGGGNCPKGRFSKRGPCDGDAGPGPKIPAPKKP